RARLGRVRRARRPIPARGARPARDAAHTDRRDRGRRPERDPAPARGTMRADMRLALAQINPVVGDLDGNRALILQRLAEAKDAGADIALFPELAVTGYPPEDLLLRPGFVR